MLNLLAVCTATILCASSAAAMHDRPWWHDAVFYEAFVRSYADSREGPLANDGVGDFRGMIERLDYLNDGDPGTTDDLGIDAIWLMPISESPSYHGYDIVDYRSVDEEYGTEADFRAFTDACHERGVRVIIDLVLNHTSNKHPWFLEASSSRDNPKRDWFRWTEDVPDYPGPWGQPVWHDHAIDTAGAHYYGCFWHGMPDLNVRHKALTEELYEIARFWIEDMGVDGFRLDAIKHLIENGADQENTQDTIDWLEDFHAYCESLNPDFFAVGEVWSSTDQVARYIPDAVDTAFEFDLALAIIDGLNSGDASRIRDRIEVVDGAYDTPVATFLTNHDQSRLMTQLGEDPGKARAAAALLLTLPGVPFIYYGEEIGHTGGKPDPNIRTPMQWDASGTAFSDAAPWRATQPDAGTVNLETQRSDWGSLWRLYQQLIRIRQSHPALAHGSITTHPSSHPSVLAFTRHTADERILVVVNTSAERTGRFSVAIDDLPCTNLAPRDIFDRSAPTTMGWFLSHEHGHLFVPECEPFQFEILVLPEAGGTHDPFKDWPRP